MMPISPLAKSAAHSGQFDVDFFFGHVQTGTKCLHNRLGCLDGSYYFRFFGSNMGKTVHRLHAVVRKEGCCISSLNHFCSLFKGSFRVSVFSEYVRSEEHTSELQSRPHLVCRLLLEKKKH